MYPHWKLKVVFFFIAFLLYIVEAYITMDAASSRANNEWTWCTVYHGVHIGKVNVFQQSSSYFEFIT